MKTAKTTKVLALAIALVMVFALAACSNNGGGGGNPGGIVNRLPSRTPSSPTQTPTQTPTPTGNGGNDPANYGTIPMPNGFPVNPGDAEFFNPVTDDYLYLHDPRAASWDGEKVYHLVSYDASGNPVQWVMKSVWPNADVIPYQNIPAGGEFFGPEREGWGDRIAADGTVVGNAGFFDGMAMFVERGADITQALRSNSLPPTKDSANWTSDRNSIDGSYVIIVSENSWIQGPPPEHFYFSKPSINAATTPDPTAPTSYTGTATNLRGKNDTTHEFYVVGTTSGSVWGSDIYTDDSTIAMAAVHAGVLEAGQAGTVTIRILPGRDSYEGTTRNGVRTSSYAKWPGSYEFVR